MSRDPCTRASTECGVMGPMGPVYSGSCYGFGFASGNSGTVVVEHSWGLWGRTDHHGHKRILTPLCRHGVVYPATRHALKKLPGQQCYPGGDPG